MGSVDVRRLAIAVVAVGLALAVAAGRETGTERAASRSERHAAALGDLLAGRASKAAAAFAALLEEDPADAKAVEGQVRALIAADDWPRALAEARRRRASLPDSPGVASALGEALFRGGRLEEAEEVVAPLAAAGDAPARALMTLGRLRAARGRTAEAAELSARALEAAPRDRDLLFWASELAPTRAEAVGVLERYLALSEGDEPERVESAQGSIRVLRALGERPIWTRIREPERIEVPLKLVWDDGGRVLGYVVKARCGEAGKPVRLLLDTGANGLFLVERVARKRGFQRLAEDVVFGGGGDRRHETSRGLFGRLAIGDLVFGDALASTTTAELEPQGRFQGILGLSVFEGYRVTMDLGAERLVLEKGEEESVGEPYWFVSGQMLVRAETTGAESGLFLFDTGAAGSFLSTSFVERSGEGRLGSESSVRTFGGRVEGSVVRGVRLRFQGLTTPGDRLAAVDLSLRSRLGRVEVSGYLGLDMLQGTRIVVDTTTRRLRAEAVAER